MNQIGRLPVVSRSDPQQLVGYLGRAEIMAARMRQLTEEQTRERLLHLGPLPTHPLQRRPVPPADEPGEPPDPLPQAKAAGEE